MPTTKNCSFEDCARKHEAKGYCSTHYFQYRKYGHPLTKEEKHEHLSNSMKKRLAEQGHPNTGRTWKLSEEQREAQKGIRRNTGRTHFKKGMAAWNKGTKGLMPEAWNKIGDGVTSENKLERRKFEATTRFLVMQRDNFTCQVCQVENSYFHVDHIKSWKEHPDLRFDMDNCRTLCVPCHYYVTFKRKMPTTSIWGYSGLTRKRG